MKNEGKAKKYVGKKIAYYQVLEIKDFKVTINFSLSSSPANTGKLFLYYLLYLEK